MTTVAPAVTDTNPFVGPRSLSRSERLHGRDLEIRELLDLVVADRIVLCCSPSGAGKTSLIQAGLTPRLEDEGFLVLPTVRLKHEPPDESVNRYVASALASVGVPSDDPATTLREGLERVPVGEDRTGLLVFDQFEEVFSLDPTDTDAKRRFFGQLGDVLRDRRWWVLFSMREDFLAALDPYLPLLPTRLGTRYRLDLLGPAAAREVVTETAASAGKTFADEASRALVTELSGLVGGRVGPYVEPVQLQVVCRRLWDRLPPDLTEITTEVIGDVGDVDGALGSYYAQEVAEAAAMTGVPERTIREWFDRELVREGGFRGQAQTGPAGDERVVRLLQDSHLVRPESRRGTTWYELAHDRLVPPVVAANRAWAEEHLTVFQRQAALWEQQGRRDELLVSGEILDQGEALAAEGDAALSVAEREFLDACGRARAAAQREQESLRLTRRLLIAATIGLVVALVASAVAFSSYRGARRARDKAEAGERLRLAAPALDLADVDPNLSAHLALRALERSDVVEDDAGRDAQEVLVRRVVDASRVGMTVPEGGVRHLEFSPDGELLATLGEDGVAVWGDGRWEREASGRPDLIALAFSPDGRRVVATDGRGLLISSPVDEERTDVEEWEASGSEKTERVAAVAFAGDGRRLVVAQSDSSGVRLAVSAQAGASAPGTNVQAATGRARAIELSRDASMMASAAEDGTVRLWHVGGDGGSLTTAELRVLRGHGGPVVALAFSSDGKYLATGGEDGSVRVWGVASGEPGRTVAMHNGTVRTLAFTADGTSLATGGTDGTVRVIDRVTARERFRADPRTGPVTSVAFHPSGNRLAVATEDGAAAVWDVAVSDAVGHKGTVYDVDFDGAGERVATASADGTAAIWNVDGHELSVLNGHGGEVNAVQFLPGGFVVTASDDGTARLWNTATADEERTFSGHTDLVYDVAVSPDGTRLATAGQDGTARIWDVGTGAEVRSPLDARDPLSGVAFSPDGRLLATAGESGTRLWEVASGRPVRTLESGELTGVAARVVFSPDGTLVASSLGDGTAVWTVATGELRNTFAEPSDTMASVLPGVDFSPDGARLATANAVIEMATGTRIARPPANGVVFHPTGTSIATAGDGTLAAIHDTATGRVLRSLGTETGDPQMVAAVGADPARGRLVTAGASTATLWDTAGRALRRFRSHDGTLTDVDLSPNGRLLVTTSTGGSATVWHVESGEQVASLAGPEGDKPQGDDVTTTQARFLDDRTVVVAPPSGGAWRWNIEAGPKPQRVSDPSRAVLGMSDNGRWMVAAAGETIEVVDLRTGRRSGAFSDVSAPSSGAVSADGKRIVVVDDDRVLVGDVRSGSTRRLRELAGDPASGDELFVLRAAISVDGRSVAAATGDGLLVWDARSGEVTLRSALSIPTAEAVAFASGSRLVMVGPEGPLLFPLSLSELKKLALARAARPLSDEECQKYLQTKAPCTPGAPGGTKGRQRG